MKRLRPKTTARPGATVVEMAVTLSVFVTLVLGMIDLGYGLFRYQVLAQSSRRLARQAVVHGQLASRLQPWGPASIRTTADSDHAVASAIRDGLVGWNLSQVELQLQWPDGGNDGELGQRVRVSISAPYEPMLTFLFGSPRITLQAESTMRIAH